MEISIPSLQGTFCLQVRWQPTTARTFFRSRSPELSVSDTKWMKQNWNWTSTVCSLLLQCTLGSWYVPRSVTRWSVWRDQRCRESIGRQRRDQTNYGQQSLRTKTVLVFENSKRIHGCVHRFPLSRTGSQTPTAPVSAYIRCQADGRLDLKITEQSACVPGLYDMQAPLLQNYIPEPGIILNMCIIAVLQAQMNKHQIFSWPSPGD